MDLTYYFIWMKRKKKETYWNPGLLILVLTTKWQSFNQHFPIESKSSCEPMSVSEDNDVEL